MSETDPLSEIRTELQTAQSSLHSMRHGECSETVRVAMNQARERIDRALEILNCFKIDD